MSFVCDIVMSALIGTWTRTCNWVYLLKRQSSCPFTGVGLILKTGDTQIRIRSVLIARCYKRQTITVSICTQGQVTLLKIRTLSTMQAVLKFCSKCQSPLLHILELRLREVKCIQVQPLGSDRAHVLTEIFWGEGCWLHSFLPVPLFGKQRPSIKLCSNHHTKGPIWWCVC